jgi:hypothetical protein
LLCSQFGSDGVIFCSICFTCQILPPSRYSVALPGGVVHDVKNVIAAGPHIDFNVVETEVKASLRRGKRVLRGNLIGTPMGYNFDLPGCQWTVLVEGRD